MKKFLMILGVITLSLTLAGNANAILYTDTFMGLAGTYHQGFGVVEYNWSHQTPSDFEVPWDVVNSAFLDVSVSWIDTYGDDHLIVENVNLLTLNYNSATYNTDIGSLFLTWNNGDTLDATLRILEDERVIGYPEWGGDLILGNMVLRLDYTNVAAPVPEPGTMLLLGSGLVGLAGFGRKKLFKKA